MEQNNYLMNGTKVRGPPVLWPRNQTYESLFSHLNAMDGLESLLGSTRSPKCVEIYDFSQMKQTRNWPIKPKYIDSA
jgi:hypothetical protein